LNQSILNELFTNENQTEEDDPTLDVPLVSDSTKAKIENKY
jgi:hypothetical protein